MTDRIQPEALRLVEQYDYGDPVAHSNTWKTAVCNELRRLHADNVTLQAGYDATQLEIDHLRRVTQSKLLAQPVAWMVYLPSIDTQHLYYSQEDMGYVDDVTNHADAEVTPLYEMAAPKAEVAPAGEYPPLPDPKFARVVDGIPCITLLEHGLLMRAYVDADRAMLEQAAPENIRSILVRCRDFIDTTKVPAYPAGADLADEIDMVLAAQSITQPAPAAVAGPSDEMVLAAAPATKAAPQPAVQQVDGGALGDLIERLLDAQQDLNVAANETMSQAIASAATLLDEVEVALRRFAANPAAPVAQGDALTPAARDVLAERQRQISTEGWTSEHDDKEHLPGELALAAASYVCADEQDAPPAIWPWDWSWWKPRDRRSNLVNSGALILAEIERIDRSQAKEGQSHD